MAETTLVLNLELPASFEEQLKAVIESELVLAQKKWRVKLSEEELQHIRMNTYAQTRKKTSTISKFDWDLGIHLMVKINALKGSMIDLTPEKPVKEKLELIITKDGWIPAPEESDNTVKLENFLENQVRQIFEWARTAAFYGVGSYAR